MKGARGGGLTVACASGGFKGAFAYGVLSGFEEAGLRADAYALLRGASLALRPGRSRVPATCKMETVRCFVRYKGGGSMDRVALGRVHDEATAEDGLRVLVDRVWARGISKDDERVGEWLKEVAPTDGLRKWFHDGGDFPNFSKKYRKDLEDLEDREEARKALDELVGMVRRERRVTLVYSSKDPEHNNAVVLKKALEQRA